MSRCATDTTQAEAAYKKQRTLRSLCCKNYRNHMEGEPSMNGIAVFGRKGIKRAKKTIRIQKLLQGGGAWIDRNHRILVMPI